MMNQLQLELIEMVYGGNALAKDAGRPIFVTGGLPGEQVRATITQDRGRYAFAVVDEVLSPSPHRIMPRCPYARAGTCGGCQWQHIEYDQQLLYKSEIVKAQFRRIGKFNDVLVHPTIASPDPWFYRTHVTYHRSAAGELGFIAPDDRTVTPIDECYIIRPELLAMRSANTATARRVRCMVGSDGSERVVSQSDDASPAAADQGDDETISGATTDKVTFTIHGETFRVSAGSFFQANLAQAARLVELVMDQVDLRGRELVLDLYSGVGLFTAFLAQGARRVTALELAPSAVNDARLNLARFDNIDVYEGATEALLPRIKGKFDAAVIDPPRAGMHAKAVEALIARSPRRIAYVSCDPSTLARDARLLVNAGYTLTHVQPVDMFPQTYHIECMAGFEKK